MVAHEPAGLRSPARNRPGDHAIHVARTVDRMMQTGARRAALHAVPMFAALSNAALRRLDAQMTEIEVPAGTVLARQHESGREAFIIAAGRAAIIVDGTVVSSAAAGDLIGEVALLDSGPRTATVTALTAMRLYVLDPSQFSALFEEPETSRWIATHLARRLRATVAALPG
jgi:CRP-like cAMP-binding protein